MEINLEKNLNINRDENLSKEQTSFLNNKIGKIINIGIDYGIRKFLPDMIEEQVIDLKDNIFNSGIKEGLNKTVNDVIKNGKEALKIVKGDFQDITQIKNVLNAGEMIDGISDLLDVSINMATKKNLINPNISRIIKNEKNIILDNIGKNIEKMYKNQFEAIEQFDLIVKDWKKAFDNNNLNRMKENHKKIMGIYKSIMPLENIINTAKKIDNIHTKIKNNNNNIKLSQEDLKLVNLLK